MATVFSGIQPTGAIHIGNYVGAISNWVRLQHEHPCYFCIVDYHAITTPYEPQEMPNRVFEVAVDILASGLDPQKCVFFVQSYVPEHTELAWVFNSLASVGALERMTQFKDKRRQFKENVSVGLFDYPVLQAADILLYKADTVPVGEDQVQHLELAREIARRFNHRFGETFPEPEAMLTKAKRIMALNDPESKMSKSLEGSFISLADTEKQVRRKIGRAVTDSGPAGPTMSAGVANLFTLLQDFASAETVRRFRAEHEDGSIRYGDLKGALADAVVERLAPIRERRETLLAQPEKVWEILADGAGRAGKVARETILEVRDRLGLRRSASSSGRPIPGLTER